MGRKRGSVVRDRIAWILSEAGVISIYELAKLYSKIYKGNLHSGGEIGSYSYHEGHWPLATHVARGIRYGEFHALKVVEGRRVKTYLMLGPYPHGLISPDLDVHIQRRTIDLPDERSRIIKKAEDLIRTFEERVESLFWLHSVRELEIPAIDDEKERDRLIRSLIAQKAIDAERSEYLALQQFLMWASDALVTLGGREEDLRQLMDLGRRLEKASSSFEAKDLATLARASEVKLKVKRPRGRPRKSRRTRRSTTPGL